MSTNQISFSSSSGLQGLQTAGSPQTAPLQYAQPQQGWTQIGSPKYGSDQTESAQTGSAQATGSRRNSITKLSMNSSTMSPRVMSPTPDVNPVQRRASLTIKSGSRPASVDLANPPPFSPSHQTPAPTYQAGYFPPNDRPNNPGFSQANAARFNQESAKEFAPISNLPNAPQLSGKLPGIKTEAPHREFDAERTDGRATVGRNLRAEHEEHETTANWEELFAPLFSDPILVMFSALGLLVLSVFCILTRDSVPFSYVAFAISVACVAFCVKKGI